MIAIINYGVGNLFSVEKALLKAGFKAVITGRAEVVKRSRGVVLPGVGAFNQARLQLEQSGLDRVIVEAVNRGLPCLGICLGLQLLFSESAEGDAVTGGLDIFKGRVVKFNPAVKVPHVGWNQLLNITSIPLFKGIAEGEYVYFDHSYYVEPENCEVVAASTRYGITFSSAVGMKNIYGVQFHPEKSGEQGLKILRNFGAITLEKKEHFFPSGNRG